MKVIAILTVLFAFLASALPAHAWTWPVEGPVLQRFELGDNPYGGGLHRGIDIGSTAGASVRAPARGLVSFAGTVPRGGRTVTIATPDGYAVTLLHLGSLVVERGRAVAEGEPVGTVGASGEPERAEPHVHLGVRLAADPHGYVDPLTLLPPLAAPPVEATDPPEQDETPADPAEQEAAEEPAPAPASKERRRNDGTGKGRRGAPGEEETPRKHASARPTSRAQTVGAAPAPRAEARHRARGGGARERPAHGDALSEVSPAASGTGVSRGGLRAAVEAAVRPGPAGGSAPRGSRAQQADTAAAGDGQRRPAAEIVILVAVVAGLAFLAAALRRRPLGTPRLPGLPGSGPTAPRRPCVTAVCGRRAPDPCARRRSPSALCGRLAGHGAVPVTGSPAERLPGRKENVRRSMVRGRSRVTRRTAAPGRGARSATGR